MSAFGGEDGGSHDKLLASMFQSSAPSKPKGPLIQAIGEEDDIIELDEGGATDVSASTTKSNVIQEGNSSVPEATSKPPVDDGPTMMEQIMAAQAEALRSKKIAKEVQERKEAKSFGGGFKAGFFGSGDNDKKSKPAGTSSGKAAIPTIRANKAAAMANKGDALKKVQEEVQKNLSEQENETIQR